jgi:dTMP kinase
MERSIAPRGGLFITLEGPDGAGKSSQARLLTDRLRGLGLEVVMAREPGGTDIGERIRRVLLEVSAKAHDPLSDALLFNAARHQLVSEVIRPALQRDAVVVCDRFADSTLAYQGYGAGAPLDALRTIAGLATGGLTPTRTLLLDLPVDAGLERRTGGPASELTRFETAEDHGRAFHERVRQGYLGLAAADPARWRIIDASDATDEVADAVWRAVSDLLPRAAAGGSSRGETRRS